MDNTLKYEKAIIELLNEYADFWRPYGGIENHILADKDKKRYQLVIVGWEHEKRFVYSVAFHIEIIDNKVWIHQNNTEAMIADELIEKGISRDDIVLGFLPPSMRKHSGFALA